MPESLVPRSAGSSGALAARSATTSIARRESGDAQLGWASMPETRFAFRAGAEAPFLALRTGSVRPCPQLTLVSAPWKGLPGTLKVPPYSKGPPLSIWQPPLAEEQALEAS